MGLRRELPIIPLAVWALLYLPRPFLFGFYHDDWWAFVEPTHATAPFSLERLRFFVGADTNFSGRFAGGFFSFLVSSLAGSSAFAYQVVIALLALIAALALRGLLADMTPEGEERPMVAADLAAAFWLALPWTLAVTAWSMNALFALLSQILFTLAVRILFRTGMAGVRAVAGLGALLVASYLTYESLYFQFAPLLLVAWLVARGGLARRRLLALAATAAGAQLLTIGVNRYVSKLNPWGSKTLAAKWVGLFQQSLGRLPSELAARLGDLALLWWALAGAIVLLSAIAVLIGVADRGSRRPAVVTSVILLAGVAAIPITVLVYSLAGYGLSSNGLMERTLHGISWAITLILFALVAAGVRQRNRWLRWALVSAAAGLVVVSGAALARRYPQWVHVWQVQQEVIARAPVAEISALPKESVVLYLGPSYDGEMVIFGAAWDLTAAVHSRTELRRGRNPYEFSAWLNPAAHYRWEWDGQELVQELPGYFRNESPVKHLVIWDYERGRTYPAAPGFRWPAVE